MGPAARCMTKSNVIVYSSGLALTSSCVRGFLRILSSRICLCWLSNCLWIGVFVDLSWEFTNDSQLNKNEPDNFKEPNY